MPRVRRLRRVICAGTVHYPFPHIPSSLSLFYIAPFALQPSSQNDAFGEDGLRSPSMTRNDMATRINHFSPGPIPTLFLLIILLQGVRCLRGAEVSNLTVALYRVSGTRVEIDWYTPRSAFDALTSCELIYGPVDQPELVQVLPNVIPDRHMLELVDLSSNVSYHFHMVCYGSSDQAKYVSNTLVFTTGEDKPRLPYKMATRYHSSVRPDRMMMISSHKSNLNMMSGGVQRPFPVALDTNQRIPNVILGATCGIVGFLIINITVVMVVRKYSYTRMRRRRMYALQYENNDPTMERGDYDGFPDI